MRVIVSVPIAVILLMTQGAGAISHSPISWMIVCVALLGAWLLTLLANLIIGALSLFIESSMKVMDVYLAAYFVLSGYLVPVELFPPFVRTLADWLPFRFQIGFPVELITGAYDASPGVAFGLLAREWMLVAALLMLALLVWSRGVRRFSAYGG
jgi:ABC-2 type transport system permease protein